LARLIQKSIFDATGLTCSVGVAPNKLLAKMASEFNKPNGIAIVQPQDLQTLIWPLACRKINGIGPKADEKLQKPRHRPPSVNWRSRTCHLADGHLWPAKPAPGCTPPPMAATTGRWKPPASR
jgi:hypothetical protein